MICSDMPQTLEENELKVSQSHQSQQSQSNTTFVSYKNCWRQYRKQSVNLEYFMNKTSWLTIADVRVNVKEHIRLLNGEMPSCYPRIKKTNPGTINIYEA
jgi:hypothetical protein